MAKPGRKPNSIPTVPWKLYIRADLAAEVELLLLDPMREKVRYGERNRLIESLLEDWLKEQRKVMATPPAAFSEGSSAPSVPCEDEGCPHYGTPHGHSRESVVK